MALPSPDAISPVVFRQLLARYPAVLQAVSDAKGAKPNQPSLAALDVVRYEQAPARFGLGAAAEAMGLDDVQTLVAWKLRHGTFRPALLKLVCSNDDAAVRTAIRDALDVYREQATAPAALVPLCRLRGIGPATASLLLAVHDPQRVVFFADEAYAWLCGGPDYAPPVRYNDREYANLCSRTAALQERLAAADDGKAPAAVDIEKVAYVLLKESKEKAKKNKTKKVKEIKEVEVKQVKTRPDKRKEPSDAQPALRRSQRVQRT